MALGLSAGDLPHGLRRGAALLVLPVEKVAVRTGLGLMRGSLAASARHGSVSEEPGELLVDAKLGEGGCFGIWLPVGTNFLWPAFASRPAALLSALSSPACCSALRCSR